MKLGRLNHIGVATPSLEASLAYYRAVMGATLAHDPFDLPAQGVKVCCVDTPGENGTAGQPDPWVSGQEPGRRAASYVL